MLVYGTGTSHDDIAIYLVLVVDPYGQLPVDPALVENARPVLDLEPAVRILAAISWLPHARRRRFFAQGNTAFPQGHSDRDPIGLPRAGIRQDEAGLHVLLAKKVLV